MKDGIKISQSKEIEEYFTDIQNRKKRNLAIINAYLDGYTQSSISKHPDLSKSLISKVIKNGDVASRV